MPEIAPSILAANPLYVGEQTARLVAAGARVLHLDIMDGHFVPNLSFGPGMVSALRKAFPQVTLDVHLMLSNPGQYLEAFAAAGADAITIHAEIPGDVKALLARIHDLGKQAGVSIKPATDPQSLAPYLDQVDLVLLMTVEPGFGGQQMKTEALEKLPILRQMGFSGILSVDGGVNEENCQLVSSYGATRLVMGTAAFQAKDPEVLITRCQGR